MFFLVSPGTSPIEARTGLAIDPQFPAKIAWLLDAAPGARSRGERGELRTGTVDSRLLWNLTGGPVHATDHSNAARTQRFDITNLAWDDELCAFVAVRGSYFVGRRVRHLAEGATAPRAGKPIPP